MWIIFALGCVLYMIEGLLNNIFYAFQVKVPRIDDGERTYANLLYKGWFLPLYKKLKDV